MMIEDRGLRILRYASTVIMAILLGGAALTAVGEPHHATRKINLWPKKEEKTG